jgi:O-antigen/teichoic acid export membrane protein
VIPVIALQSFLITGVFRDGRIRQSAIAKLVAVGTGALVILAAAGWVLGPFLVSLISGGRFSIEGWLIAVIVISAGLTAAMCTTGPALIAMRRHTANVVGWLTAAALTIIALLLPLEENARITVALIVPVVIGLIIHALALGRARPRSGQ